MTDDTGSRVVYRNADGSWPSRPPGPEPVSWEDHTGLSDDAVHQVFQVVPAPMVDLLSVIEPETSALRQRPEDQPLPKGNTNPICHDLLQDQAEAELPRRLELGVSRYGQPLQPFNGRDFGKDAMEEFWDLGVYLQGLLFERQAMIDLLQAVRRLPNESNPHIMGAQAEVFELLKAMGEA